MNILDQIKNLEDTLKTVQSEIDRLKEEYSKPKIDQRAELHHKYYFIDSSGDVDHSKENKHPVDNRRFNYGNYYLTKELAQEASDRRFATQRVARRLRELEPNDWEVGFVFDRKNWSIYHWRELNLECWCVKQSSPAEWYSTKEAWKQVIKEMESDVKLMLGVKDDPQ